MAKKIRRGVVRAYFMMLKVWSILLLGIVGIFSSRDVWALDETMCKYGVDINWPNGRPGISYAQYKRNQWQGISQSKDYSADSYQLIKDKVCFEKEWKRLGINSLLPEVDFTKSTLVEIVKINSSREITFKETLYKETEGVKNSKVIVINYYIESAARAGNLAYFFLVTPNFDVPILIQEQKYYDDTFIARDYIYSPGECAYNPIESKPAVPQNPQGDLTPNKSYNKVEKNAFSTIYFSDDFQDGNFIDKPRWYYNDNNSKVVTGIEGDTHNSSLKWGVLDGFLYFYEGDFTGLDLASDEINIPAGLDKLVIEFDTYFGGTWANHNLITLEDVSGNVVFGGGIYCDGYSYMKGNHKTNNGLLLIGSAQNDKKELPDDSLNPSTWKHVKIIFDNGNITIDCDNGEFSFTQKAKFTELTEIKRIRIGGWQHTKGARFDNITVWR